MLHASQRIFRNIVRYRSKHTASKSRYIHINAHTSCFIYIHTHLCTFSKKGNAILVISCEPSVCVWCVCVCVCFSSSVCLSDEKHPLPREQNLCPDFIIPFNRVAKIQLLVIGTTQGGKREKKKEKIVHLPIKREFS